jgi:hypothetical protein
VYMRACIRKPTSKGLSAQCMPPSEDLVQNNHNGMFHFDQHIFTYTVGSPEGCGGK